MFDLLDVIRKLLSQIIIGVRIIRWFGLMDELRYYILYPFGTLGFVRSTGPIAVARRRSVCLSVCPSPVTRQPMFGFV